MSTNKMREALEALLAKPSDDLNDATEDADGYFRTPYRRAEIAAHEALAADDAARGTMQEEFEAWWTREGATMCIGSSQAIARISWQASRAAAPQGEVGVTKNKSGQIVCVTRQDADGQILSVIAGAAAPQAEYPQSAGRVKVERTCPRCRVRAYHLGNDRGRKNAIACVACGHEWFGRITKDEQK